MDHAGGTRGQDGGPPEGEAHGLKVEIDTHTLRLLFEYELIGAVPPNADMFATREEKPAAQANARKKHPSTKQGQGGGQPAQRAASQSEGVSGTTPLGRWVSRGR